MTDPDRLRREFYEQQYSDVSVSARPTYFQRYLHKALERPYGPDTAYRKVLEVGGNRGEHVPYVRHGFDEYHLTDLTLPQPEGVAATDPRVRIAAVDAGAIPHPDDTFDRVVCTCVLHHVDSPLTVAEELRRVTRPGGVVSILVPTDPGLAYRLAHGLTSGRAARKRGLGAEFRLIHALNHRNHVRSIATQLRAAFVQDDLDVTWLPLRVPSTELNVLTVWQVRVAG